MEPITLDDIPVMIMVVGRDHIIGYCNAHSFDVFGYKPEELVGQNIDLLVPEEFKPKHHGQIEDFYKAPVTRPLGIGRDLHGRCKDGTPKRVEISLTFIMVQDQPCVLTIVVDVNIRKFLETLAAVTEVMKKTKEEALEVIEELTPELTPPAES